MLSDLDYMERALRLAERGLGRTAPNPVVGAVIVSPEGVVVGQGYHERAGEDHAEVRALRAAGDRARGATLYCTLEPCCHTGRTGPCVERIAASGIARVVTATEDPNPLVRRGGISYLRSRGIHVDVGMAREAAMRLNQPFFTYIRHRRPFVILKVATSLDGCIAAAPGVRTQLTSEAAVQHVHRTRAQMDAVAVGSGTILIDDPLLTVRGIFRERPLARVVFDRRLRIAPDARLFSTLETGPIVIITSAAALESEPDRARMLSDAGARLEPVGDGLKEAFERLAELDITSVMLEGGNTIHAAAWQARLVDRVQLYIAPQPLGETGRRWMEGEVLSIGSLSGTRIRALGTDILIEGDVHRPD